MKFPVILTIRGSQRYLNQEPETLELVTEGTLEKVDGGWRIQYEESDLTGLSGVTTTFELEPEKITLTRVGPLNSQMVFQEGMSHNSLYQLEFGALMLTVCAKKVRYTLNELGGAVDLLYGIEIENTASGEIAYHLDVRRKEE